MAEPVTVQVALDRLWAGFHFRPDPADEAVTLAEWVEALHGIPDPAVSQATRDWLTNNDRFPTLNQFMTACQAAARLLMAVPSGSQRAITSGDHVVSAARAGQWMAAIRKTWDDAPPKHDHREGIEACPRCAYVENHLDENAGYDPSKDDSTSPCRGCTGVGFVAQDEGWRPCEFCNTATYERWAGGHWADGHTCAECAAMRAGRR